MSQESPSLLVISKSNNSKASESSNITGAVSCSTNPTNSANIINPEAVEFLSALINTPKKQNQNHKKNGKKGVFDVDALWRKKGILIKNNDAIDKDRDIDKPMNKDNGESNSENGDSMGKKTTIANRPIKSEPRETVIPVKTLADTPIASATETIIIDKNAFQAVKSVLAPKGIGIVRVTTTEGQTSGGVETTELVESSGYAPSAPQYVSTDFSTIDYPISSHISTTVAPGSAYSVYGADSSSYATYYQYSGNVHSPSQTYMLTSASGGGQGGQSPISVDDDSGVLGHTTRASPATIQWLLDNYETADGTSLPRCTLYDHYKRHCAEHRLEPVNAASFGKLIRSVFLGLRTRRLGTRGNSKYHYYGIRIKPDSPLIRSQLEEYAHIEVTPRTAIKRPAPSSTASRHSSSSPHPIYSSPPSQPSQPSQPVVQTPTIVTSTDPQQISVIQQTNSSVIPNPTVAQTQPQPQPQAVIMPMPRMQTSDIDKASLGEGQVPHVPLPALESVEENLRKIGLDITHLMKFADAYMQNCADVLYCIKQLQFEGVEECWLSFWQPEDESIEEEEMLQIDKLSQQQIFSLCTLPQIQNYILQSDVAFYQVIVDILVPNVLMSQMTPNLTQQCRNFAKNVEMYLKKAMQGAPDTIQKKKLQALKYMAQGLKRYTSLNHLAQAARAVLQKPEQVTAMYNDYVRVDISQVQEQAGWVAGCDNLMVQHIHAAFKQNLQHMVPMEQWAEWLESIVDQILAKYHDKPVQTVADVGKQFLLNWSFYTSMVIRDLTLRSASSFGSFHLIRLLADDYMFYLVETRIAKAAQQPVILVIRQDKDLSLFEEPSHQYLSPIKYDENNQNKYLPHENIENLVTVENSNGKKDYKSL